jgi:hypothetical protein
MPKLPEFEPADYCARIADVIAHNAKSYNIPAFLWVFRERAVRVIWMKLTPVNAHMSKLRYWMYQFRHSRSFVDYFLVDRSCRSPCSQTSQLCTIVILSKPPTLDLLKLVSESGY